MIKATYELTFTEAVLGSKPSNDEVFSDYIAANKQDGVDPEELEAAKAAQERVKESMTVFHRMEDNVTPMVWNYQIKGLAKESCGALRRVEDTLSSKIASYKTIVDTLIFVAPRKIPLVLPEGGKVGVLERPLRAETMQGPRVALAKSETVPAGTKLTFTVTFMANRVGKAEKSVNLKEVFEEWLDYGELHGFGQWRGGGHGTFTWKELKTED